ncbi:MAG: hypothetical protein PHV45_08620, partial [Desulfuromonas thiophila]|nr:hypothetical protein [Desulfuromonas thiophila]
TNGQTVTVSYTDPTAADDTAALQDIIGNDAASLVDGAVSNLTAAPPSSGGGSAPAPEPDPEDPEDPEDPLDPEDLPDEIPSEADWDSLADDDGDGVPELVEAFVPTLGGEEGAIGDGNGDGISDMVQQAVASIPFRQTSQISQNPDAPQTFVSLVADSNEGQVATTGSNGAEIMNIQQLDAPEDIPSDLNMPLGLISFTAAIGTIGATESFSLYVAGDIAVNGYWKQNAAGDWVNLASSAYGGAVIEQNGRTRLDFVIEDGGEFDADGLANGVIVDPGAIGFRSETAANEDDPTAVTRLFSPFSGFHLYTASEDEINAATQSGWQIEGRAFGFAAGGSLDVYRFFNTINGDHFFTTSAQEAEIVQNSDWGYVFEGVVFALHDTAEGRSAIQRFYNAATGEHFYTAYEEEAIVVTGQLGFTYEGVLGYAIA